MLHTISDALNALVADGRIAVEETPPFIRDYAASAAVRHGLERVNAPVYSARATGSLYVDQRLEVVEESDGWTALVLKVPAERNTIATAAGPSVVHVLETPAPLTVRCYSVEGFPDGGDVPGDMRLRAGESFAVAAGGTFVIPGGPQAVSLEGPVGEARFLRFSAPARSPITVAFAGDERPQTVAFTDQEASGRQFFAALLLDLVRGTPASPAIPLGEEDLESVRGFIDMGLADDTHLVTKWKLAQLAARISPARARAFFVELAQSGHVNAARQAARVVERIGGGPH